MLDYDLFCNVFDNMIEEGHIYNKYKDSDQKKESYNNNNNTQAINNNISQSQDMRTPASHINTSLVTPSSEALNNSSSHSSSCSINVKDLYILIETKVRSDAASSKRGHFNFIQNLGGGGGGYGDPSSFKEGHLVVQKNHTLRKIRWCKVIR